MTLRDYAGVIVRRKWIVIAAALVTTVIAVVLSALQTPIYSTDAEVLIQPRGQDGLFEDQIVNLNDRAIETEIQVIEGQAVRARVQQDLELSALPDDVAASSVGATDVISVRVRDANATNAATLATAYADAYIDIRREQSVAELLAASTEVQTAIDDLRTQIEVLSETDPQRASLSAQLANFQTTLDQLRVDAALRTGGASVIKDAEVPTSPVEPTPLRTAALALIVGLLIGLGAAFLVDYLDDKVRSGTDLETITRRPILSEVPVDPPTDNLPLAMSDPTHVSVEAYRGLRTNVQFLALDQKLDVLQVTSSLPGEGKTTTSTNLAVVLARAGQRVALVDADLRRPRIHEVFGIAASPGLTDMLLGAAPRETAKSVGIGDGYHIDVYTAGVVPSNPSEMLGGTRMRNVMERMGEYYDFVVVDSAPILPVSDSVALAGFVDAVIVVAQAGRVTTGNVHDTLERLERVSAPVVGLVLNQTRGTRSEAYAYGGYGAPGAGSGSDSQVGSDPTPKAVVVDERADESFFPDTTFPDTTADVPSDV